MNFVQVYLAKGEMEAFIIKGLFESVGIKSNISAMNSPINNTFPISMSPYLMNTPDAPFGVYVEKNNEGDAKKILAERK